MNDHLETTRRTEFLGSPILATKLYRPSLPTDLVPRAHLLERLDCNRMRPLMLISAPAGYGKTTLASFWLQVIDCASSWVSLDEGDDDLRTFVTYLVAAVGSAFPECRLKTLGLLETPLLPPPPTLARYLLNDLDQIGRPFILALDDLHTVREQAIYDLLTELLRHPSRSMHLLLISRRDPPLPLVSLRARGQVFEIRAWDLSFTTAEAAGLLSRLLHREIDERTAEAWTHATEGWVTGLQLAALSLLHRSESDDLKVADLVTGAYLQEYLMAEVLAQLPPATQLSLISLSILNRFCASLCDVLCRADTSTYTQESAGKAFIDWLRANNLFLIPLDNEGTWFRFHHLFRQFLQPLLHERFQTGEIAALHLRAGNWLEENRLWDEALRYFLASGDTSVAVQFFVRHRHELINAQQWHRLERWLMHFPGDVVAQDPYLMTSKVYLAVHGQSWRASDIKDQVQHATQLVAALPPETEESRALRAEITAIKSLVDVAMGKPTAADVTTQQELRALPARAMLVRVLGNSVIAASLQMQGQYELGIDCLREPAADPNFPLNLQAYAMQFCCIVCFMEGDLDKVISSGLDCLRIAQEPGNLWLVGYARYHLGVAHYQRNELEEAEGYLSALLEDQVMVAPTYLAYGTFALALIHLARGQPRKAEQSLELALSHFGEVTEQFAIATLEACSVELALRKGDLDEARRTSAGVEFDLRPPTWFFYVPQLTPIKLLLAEGTPASLVAARVALESLDEQMTAIHRKSVRIDVLSLLALVCDALGDTSTAYAKLLEALVLANPGGFIRNFVDLGQPMSSLLARLQRRKALMQPALPPYIGRLLAAFPASGSGPSSTEMPVSAPPSVNPLPRPFEPLTAREMQTLRFLSTELSPEEIAQQMSIAPTTVRTHISRIYSKLGVHSRHAAVYRAQQLGLQ